MSFEPIRHIPDVKLTLRADTSIRAVQRLPASIAAVAGLSSLTVQAFTFEDPGGWCTSANFNLGPLASCKKLRYLELQLGTWECEHCEVFELPGLQELSQLSSLKVLVTSRFVGLGQEVQEVLLALPGMRPAQQLHITTSMRLVLRNSKVLARAADPGVLAHSILLEEPLPQRKTPAAAAAAAAAATAGPAANTGSKNSSSSSVGLDTARGRDQTPAAAAPAAAAASSAAADQPQYVRAPAHVVISALRDLWPGIEVWQYPMKVPGISSWQQVTPELLCKTSSRDDVQQQLWQQLVRAAGSGDLQDADVSGNSSGGMRLW
jgi:hypothetical protein